MSVKADTSMKLCVRMAERSEVPDSQCKPSCSEDSGLHVKMWVQTPLWAAGTSLCDPWEFLARPPTNSLSKCPLWIDVCICHLDTPCPTCVSDPAVGKIYNNLKAPATNSISGPVIPAWPLWPIEIPPSCTLTAQCHVSCLLRYNLHPKCTKGHHSTKTTFEVLVVEEIL